MTDAFSSDAVPAHLLTREALALYDARLSEGGLLLFHLSNRHLELAPVVARLAADGGCSALVRRHRPEGDGGPGGADYPPGDRGPGAERGRSPRPSVPRHGRS